MEEKYAYLSVIAILLIIIPIALISSHNTKEELRGQIYVLNSNLKDQTAKINELTIELNSLNTTTNSLNNANQKLSSDKQTLEKEVRNLRLEAQRTIDELTDFNNNIKSSLEWFNLNSEITNLQDYYSTEIDLKRDCLKIDDSNEEKECIIKLSCLNFVNTNKTEFSYRFDNETSSKQDELQSLQEIYDNQGGDCEDFSLLAKAELNYLVDYCKEKKGKKITFTGYEKKEGEKHFVEFSNQYFIKDAEDYMFSLSNYYVVCGNLPKNKWESAGHCLLGFSSTPLADGVYESLKNAILIEPQTGSIVNDLRRSSDIQIPKDSIIEGTFISLVFDDNDMYIFSKYGNDYKWVSYSMFSEKLTSLKDNLNKLLV